MCVPAADGVIHTAFLHDGSVPYLEAIKIDCAAIKAMTDAMVGTDKPFVQSSATGVIGTLWSALLVWSALLNDRSTRLSTGNHELASRHHPKRCAGLVSR